MRQSFCALALSVAGIAASANAAELFGVASFDPFVTQGLYSIDTTTGAATLIGDTGVAEITGLAFDFASGTMYGYTTHSDLYSVDLTTGAASLIADDVAIVPEGDLAFGPTGDLFATNGGDFGSVSMLTAAFDVIGPMGTDGFDISGLAFDASGMLFGYAMNGTLDGALLEINPDTGVAALVGISGIVDDSAVAGLDVNPDDDGLFLSNGEGLYAIDRATGTATFLGAHGVSGMSGIAFIPAPSTVALMGLGLLAAGRRR
jgi:hypothetical protein